MTRTPCLMPAHTERSQQPASRTPYAAWRTPNPKGQALNREMMVLRPSPSQNFVPHGRTRGGAVPRGSGGMRSGGGFAGGWGGRLQVAAPWIRRNCVRHAHPRLGAPAHFRHHGVLHDAARDRGAADECEPERCLHTNMPACQNVWGTCSDPVCPRHVLPPRAPSPSPCRWQAI